MFSPDTHLARTTMKLVLLGTTGYHPNETRHTACLLLPQSGAMFDAGTALFRAPRYLQTPSLDIFLTHAHLDHVVGLTYLFSVVRQHALERTRVWGEEDKLAAIREHLFSEQIFPAWPPMEFSPLTKGQEIVLSDGGRVSHFPLKHVGGTVGYRVDWPGRSMAYVTDTTAAADADYVDRIRGVDLLVHECYFPDQLEDWAAKTGHSCTTPVAQVAKAAGVGRLVLVHTDPIVTDPDPVGLEAAKKIFPRMELGSDLQEIEF
ncbi:MAG: MBL fold metallo-hydrolase [Thermoguttaceae bacterium]